MKLDFTPYQDGDDLGGGVEVVRVDSSRIEGLVVLFRLLHSNVYSAEGSDWDVVHQTMFEGCDVPENGALDQLLWHLVLSSWVKATGEVSRDVFLDGGVVQREGVGAEEALNAAFSGMTEPVWHDPIVKRSFPLEDLLSELCDCYERWQEALVEGETSHGVRNVGSLLRRVFLREFRNEVLASHQGNKPLVASIPDSWQCEDRGFESWVSFLQENEDKVNQRIGYESFSLNDIYIDLRCTSLRQKKGENGSVAVAREGAYLTDSVSDWVDGKGCESAMLAIVGHGGSGKSAFCQMFVARHAMDLYKKGVTTLLVSMVGVKEEGDLSLLLDDYFSQAAALSFNPLGSDYLQDHRVLLILDGLDHLSVPEQEREGVTRRLIEEAARLCADANQGVECSKLQIIFVGGPDMVRSSPDFFYGASLLEVLPLFPGSERDRLWWPKKGGDGKEFPDLDQSQQWWKRWSQLTGKNIPEQMGGGASFGVGGMESLPFFNYLIAHVLPKLSSGGSEEISIEDIYLSLLDSFFVSLDSGGTVSRERFLVCLEEVSVWVRNGKALTWSASEIHEALNRSRFIRCVVGEEIGLPLAEVMHTAVSFFSLTEKKGDGRAYQGYMICDYLVATRLLKIIRWFCENQVVAGAEQGRHDYLDASDELLFWTEMTASVEMDRSMFTFLRSLLRNTLNQLTEKEQAHWQSVFAELFSDAVLGSVPIERVEGYSTYREMLEGACRAETALVVALGGIAAVTQRVSPVEWKASEPQVLGSWLMKMNGQHVDYLSPSLGYGVSQVVPSPFILDSLNYLDFSHQILSVQNLSSASLRGGVFSKVVLSRSSLRYADLRDACMERSEMREVSMCHANLSGANLDYADLRGARMESCEMRGTSLVHALLNQANLNDAMLDGGALSWALLDDALLKHTVLDDARMNGVSMCGSNFHCASMVRCNLDDVKASTASFDHCNLSDASLIGGVLNECSFSEARLNDACLYRAEMKSAHFLDCRMSRINLEASDLRETTFRGCDLQSASLNKADLTEANFASDCSLHGASLIGVRLHGAVFDHVDFRMAIFEKAEASGETHFIECDLSGADFSEVDLEAIDMSGNQLEGGIFISARLKLANLTEANLGRAVMDRADLSEAVLAGACLDEASLFQVNLKKSQLKSASLKGVNLHGADLAEADLRGVDFSDASLFGARLEGADLQNANLSGASLFGANVEGARLRAEQLSEEQKEQIRGTPDWVYEDDILGRLQNRSGDSLDSLTITSVRETVIQDGELMVEESQVSSVTSTKEKEDEH